MKTVIAILLLGLVLLLIALDSAIASNDKDIAVVLKSTGKVNIKRANPNKWQNAEKGMRLNSGDIVKTGENALMAIMFTDDKSMIKIRENSTLAIKGKREKSTIAKRLKFAIGQMWVKVDKQKSEFLVETPSGVAAVKGTEFYIFSDENGNTMIIAIEGIISFMNKLGEILIRAGETGLASKLTAPTVRQTDNSEIPNWGNEGDSAKMIEIEFQDSEGNKKTLKINYE